ncbi:putative disease resistance RPP13-like protein 1 [Bienertia sinuspersici]
METAGTYVVVPFISGFFNVLIDRLAPEDMRNLLMGYGDASTAAELSQLRNSMIIVKRAANIAEEKQEIDGDVKRWLDDVKHALYDAENLLDTIGTEALRKRVQCETISGTVISSITSVVGGLAAALNPFHEGIDTRIRKVNQRFVGFSQLIDALGLRSDLEQSKKQSDDSRDTSYFIDESMTYGRASERDQIIKVLEDGAGVSESTERQIRLGKEAKEIVPLEHNICVIAIVGMAGIGKTTLAQLVYNHPTASRIFDLKAWIYVPERFDATYIIGETVRILDGTTSYERFNKDKLQLHQEKLREQVAGKRILIILDDIWEEILHDKWQKVLISLKPAAPGSTIIVTTRNEHIATNLHPKLTLCLDQLPDEDAWTLFKALAFGDPQAAPDENFETMGRKVVAKCGGLPLAIASLGRLLNRFRSNTKEWENVASSALWDSHPDVRKEILPALLLSFYYLDEPVKRCYAYCSIFPKNFQFDKENLVLLWMAEGFIQMPTSNSSKTVEDIGETYFDELKAHSFFQVSNSEQQYFVMHDLIHDLAVYVMGDFGLMLDPNFSINVSEKLRHLSYNQSKYDSDEKLKVNAHRLRTFLPVGSGAFSTDHSCCYYLSKSVLKSLEQFGCLRVLSLCGYKITHIPDSIGSLLLLRYLDFSFTNIEELPDSICDLSNLQTLLLRHCERLKKLPAMTKNLLHLRHLDIEGTKRLEEMPNDIGKLSCCQTLTGFVVSKDNKNSIRELGGFSQLRGSLCIYRLGNVVDEADIYQANLSGKAHLDGLALGLRGDASLPDNQHEKLIDASKPHIKLGRLAIGSYRGGKIPDWVGDKAYCNLEFLHLKSCSNCVKLPSLGQLPSLKHLIINDFEKLKTVGQEFYGQHNESLSPFKSLVTLEFVRLKQWKNWYRYGYGGEVEPFVCLEKLIVWDCEELEGDIPLRLPSLLALEIHNCNKLDGPLPDCLKLRKLDLRSCGKLDLTGLTKITTLTELSLCGTRRRLNETKRIANAKDALPFAKEALPLMTSLEKLTIYDDEERSNVTPGLGWHLPSSVRSVTITGHFIQEFHTFIENCTHLQYMCIKGLKCLIQFPPGQSRLLNYLEIDDCSRLEHSEIIDEGDFVGFESLHEVRISQSFSRELNRGLLAARNLTALSLSYCCYLSSLPTGMAAHFPCLQFLSIVDCPDFVKFPEDGLPPKLQTMEIKGCDHLAGLPNYISSCTSLERLSVCYCSSLISTVGSLPPYLKFLELGHLQNYAKWNLNQLTSLQELRILGDRSVESFPENDSLPNSLTILYIYRFPKLRSINCAELQRIPCLRELEIKYCQSLLLLCDGDLPQSLYRLTLRGCPKLASRCHKPDGHYVHMTSHITCLDLDDYEPYSEERLYNIF